MEYKKTQYKKTGEYNKNRGIQGKQVNTRKTGEYKEKTK